MTRDSIRETRKRIEKEFGELPPGTPKPTHQEHKQDRTALQKIIEDQEGMDIEDVLSIYDAKDIAAKYHLDLSTISKWKERLGLRDRREE